MMLTLCPMCLECQRECLELFSGVSAVCPVSALTGGQSAIVPRVSVRVSARSAVSPEASSVVRQAADKPTVA